MNANQKLPAGYYSIKTSAQQLQSVVENKFKYPVQIMKVEKNVRAAKGDLEFVAIINGWEAVRFHETHFYMNGQYIKVLRSGWYKLDLSDYLYEPGPIK